MKQTIVRICVVAALALMLAGCKAASTESTPQNGSSAGESAISSSNDSSKAGTAAGIDSYLKSFEKQLGEKNLKLQGKSAKDAASIGAAEGYGFTIADKPIEIYLFDESSSDKRTADNLKTARESGYITIFGVSINGKEIKSNCIINDSLILIFPTEDILGAHPDKEAIVEAFMNIA